jgi:hypothetical protein
MSLRGALEYDQENDLVKCHECGLFFKALAPHARQIHRMRAREYKIAHGLRIRSALIAESTRRLYSKASIRKCVGGPQAQMAALRALNTSPNRSKKTRSRIIETDNSKRMCDAQILQRLRDATKQLGRPPTLRELSEFHFSVSTLARHFGSLRRLFELARIQGRDSGGKWGTAALLAFINNFIHIHGREPHTSDADRGLIPSSRVYSNRFGGLGRAIALARKRKFRRTDALGRTKIRPISASKRRGRSHGHFLGVNIGRLAIGALR